MRRVRALLSLSATLASFCALLVFAAPAAATCLNGIYDEALPVTSLTPAGGTSIAPSGSLAASFALVSSVQHATLFVRLTSQNTLGQNGTLSDLHILDMFALADSTTDPGNYGGVSHIGPTLWTNYPGTYYWQLFGSESHYDPGTLSVVCHTYASAVFSITVATPPPPPPPVPPTPPSTPPALSAYQAPSYAASMVSQRQHRRPRLAVSCTQVDTWTLHCSVAWRVRSSSYAATGKFWHFLSNGSPYWTYDFSGTRTWRTCVRRHRKTRCTTHRQHFRWQ